MDDGLDGETKKKKGGRERNREEGRKLDHFCLQLTLEQHWG